MGLPRRRVPANPEARDVRLQLAVLGTTPTTATRFGGPAAVMRVRGPGGG